MSILQIPFLSGSTVHPDVHPEKTPEKASGSIICRIAKGAVGVAAGTARGAVAVATGTAKGTYKAVTGIGSAIGRAFSVIIHPVDNGIRPFVSKVVEKTVKNGIEPLVSKAVLKKSEDALEELNTSLGQEKLLDNLKEELLSPSTGSKETVRSVFSCFLKELFDFLPSKSFWSWSSSGFLEARIISKLSSLIKSTKEKEEEIQKKIDTEKAKKNPSKEEIAKLQEELEKVRMPENLDKVLEDWKGLLKLLLDPSAPKCDKETLEKFLKELDMQAEKAIDGELIFKLMTILITAVLPKLNVESAKSLGSKLFQHLTQFIDTVKKIEDGLEEPFDVSQFTRQVYESLGDKAELQKKATQGVQKFGSETLGGTTDELGKTMLQLSVFKDHPRLASFVGSQFKKASDTLVEAALKGGVETIKGAILPLMKEAIIKILSSTRAASSLSHPDFQKKMEIYTEALIWSFLSRLSEEETTDIDTSWKGFVDQLIDTISTSKFDGTVGELLELLEKCIPGTSKQASQWIDQLQASLGKIVAGPPHLFKDTKVQHLLNLFVGKNFYKLLGNVIKSSLTPSSYVETLAPTLSKNLQDALSAEKDSNKIEEAEKLKSQIKSAATGKVEGEDSAELDELSLRGIV